MNNNNNEIYVRLGDVEGLSNIFTNIAYDFTEVDETFTKAQLNAMYSKRSKNKIISPYVQDNLASASFSATSPDVFGRIKYRWTATISNNEKQALADYINAKYKEEWDRLKGVYKSEYNPIVNYDRIENEEITTEHTGTDTTVKSGSMTDNLTDTFGHVNTENLQHGESITETPTLTEQTTYNTTDAETKNMSHSTIHGESITTTGTDSKSGSDDLFGFNSSSAQHAAAKSESGSSSKTETHSGTDSTSDNGTDNVTKTGTETKTTTGNKTEAHSGTDIKTDTESGSDTHNRTQTYNNVQDKRTANLSDGTERTLEVTGNIGVTTSQQMLESEIALWKWNFLETVFNCVDSVLALLIY